MNQKLFKSRGKNRLEKFLDDYQNNTTLDFPVVNQSLASISPAMISFSDFIKDKIDHKIRAQLLPEFITEVKKMLPSYVRKE